MGESQTNRSAGTHIQTSRHGAAFRCIHDRFQEYKPGDTREARRGDWFSHGRRTDQLRGIGKYAQHSRGPSVREALAWKDPEEKITDQGERPFTPYEAKIITEQEVVYKLHDNGLHLETSHKDFKGCTINKQMALAQEVDIDMDDRREKWCKKSLKE